MMSARTFRLVARRALLAVGAASVVAAATACAPAGPRALAEGDSCGFCRMEVTDERFGAQVVTATGKVLMFDSVECLAGYVRSSDATSEGDAWVADVEKPAQWVRAADAGFLVGSTLRGPMGHVISFATPAAAHAAQRRLGGTTASWAAIRSDSAGVTAHGPGGH